MTPATPSGAPFLGFASSKLQSSTSKRLFSHFLVGATKPKTLVRLWRSSGGRITTEERTEDRRDRGQKRQGQTRRLDIILEQVWFPHKPPAPPWAHSEAFGRHSVHSTALIPLGCLDDTVDEVDEVGVGGVVTLCD